MIGDWWLVVGGWWLVVGGGWWWLLGGWLEVRPPLLLTHNSLWSIMITPPGTTANYTLLEDLNTAATKEYTDMTDVASQLNEEMVGLRDKCECHHPWPRPPPPPPPPICTVSSTLSMCTHPTSARSRGEPSMLGHHAGGPVVIPGGVMDLDGP